jgi:hypothetical protein
MQFNDADLDSFLDAFNAQSYPVKVNDAQVATLRGIYKRRTEFISPHMAEDVVIKPSLRCKTSDLDAFDMNHRIEIGGIDYKFWREPVENESGLSIVGLVKA